MAIASYARAMDHVGIMAIDPHFRWSDRVILDLHFDACHFQRDKLPGLLRTDPIYVTSPRGGAPAYEGPPYADVPGLMGRWAIGSSVEISMLTWSFALRWRSCTSSPCIRFATGTAVSLG
jgi:hypothetical protein